VARVIDSTAISGGFISQTDKMLREEPQVSWLRAYVKPLGRYNEVRIWAVDGDTIHITLDQLGKTPSKDYINAETLLTNGLRKLDPTIEVRTTITPFFL
jgi:hypothetical protein